MKPEELILVLGMAAVTFGVRYPVLALVGKIQLPPALVKALRYVPPTVLTAIIVPEVLFPGGNLRLSLTSPYIIGAIASILIAWRTKNLLLTIILGMGIFFVAAWQFGL
ncbi:MAG: AzlD domain-containing protein [Anaerolineae bacterium]|nr:AzlD domain-containing protein [Anaerolineae bacterium]